MKNSKDRFVKKIKNKLETIGWNMERRRIKKYPPYTMGYANLFGKKFKFHDRLGFLITYDEIFKNGIYKFISDNKKKVIVDCGANIGVSVLFFSLNYPDHKIIAFEPDEFTFSILKENVEEYKLKNVELHQRAVWNKEDVLKFYTDGGLGARVNEAYRGQSSKSVKSVRLKEYLNQEIDFLKIDIEGAEFEVLEDCKELLSKVNNLFFEYHGFIDRPQKLHEMLKVINQSGFHYYIKESLTRKRPFMDRQLICESFDMAINIFCYKEEEMLNKL
jgi:FkbM family methyltransferase